jgi:hypothetical protein
MIDRIIAHFLAHPLGVIGLVLNMMGGAMLLWFPPSVRTFDDDGRELLTRVATTPVVPHGRLRCRLSWWGFRVAILLFVIGFTLQLLDLLLA